MVRQLASKSIYARNGLPSANQGLSIAEPRHGHAFVTVQVNLTCTPGLHLELLSRAGGGAVHTAYQLPNHQGGPTPLNDTLHTV